MRVSNIEIVEMFQEAILGKKLDNNTCSICGKEIGFCDHIFSIEKFAKNNKLNLNPNKKITSGITLGLLKNLDKYGKMYCPCRIQKTDDNVCPCIYSKKEIEEKGRCHCNLFVKEI